MPSFFDGAHDFGVRNLKVENIDGNYTDERDTFVEHEEIRKSTYNQEGAVGVVNGHGRFEGEINYRGGLSAPKKRKSHRECLRRVETRVVLNPRISQPYRDVARLRLMRITHKSQVGPVNHPH